MILAHCPPPHCIIQSHILPSSFTIQNHIATYPPPSVTYHMGFTSLINNKKLPLSHALDGEEIKKTHYFIPLCQLLKTYLFSSQESGNTELSGIPLDQGEYEFSKLRHFSRSRGTLYFDNEDLGEPVK